jgi:hypothetical protein
MNTVQQYWKIFEEATIPANTLPAERREKRRVFLVGASSMMDIHLKIAHSIASEDSKQQVLEACYNELRQFIDDIEQGRA